MSWFKNKYWPLTLHTFSPISKFPDLIILRWNQTSATQCQACVPSRPLAWKSASDVATKTWRIHRGPGMSAGFHFIYTLADQLKLNWNTGFYCAAHLFPLITRRTPDWPQPLLTHVVCASLLCALLFLADATVGLISWGQWVYQEFDFLQKRH